MAAVPGTRPRERERERVFIKPHKHIYVFMWPRPEVNLRGWPRPNFWRDFEQVTLLLVQIKSNLFAEKEKKTAGHKGR